MLRKPKSPNKEMLSQFLNYNIFGEGDKNNTYSQNRMSAMSNIMND